MIEKTDCETDGALVSTHQLVVVSHEALEVDKAADGGRQVGQLVPAEIRDHIL